jgi:drug/metabolite transporter (DMT)-like permease
MAIGTSFPHAIDSRRGYAMMLMVVGSVVISFGGLVQRNIEFADPWQVSFYRAIGLLGAVIVIIGFNNRVRKLRTMTGIGGLGLLAGAMVSVAGISFVQALAHTSVANALFILGAIPFFTALFARLFLGEKLRRATLVAMVGAAIGLGIMVVRGLSVGTGFGNAMAVLTAVSFALFAVIVRYKRQTDMLPVLLLSSVIVVAISALVKMGDINIPPRDIFLCLFWGGCLSGFVNWMFIIASRHLAAAEVTLIMLLEFSLGPVWVWLFISETPSIWTVIGGGLIILAVALRAAFELVAKPKLEQTTSGPI